MELSYNDETAAGANSTPDKYKRIVNNRKMGRKSVPSE